MEMTCDPGTSMRLEAGVPKSMCCLGTKVVAHASTADVKKRPCRLWVWGRGLTA